MTRFFLSLVLFISGLCVAEQQPVKPESVQALAPTKKPKLIIFSSRGGYGHQAASQELEKFFADEYEVKTVYWFEEGPLKKTDEVRRFSFGLTSGEKLYNFLLKKEWTRLLRMVVNQGPSFMRSHRWLMYEAMHEFLSQEKPDFIISVAPAFNLPAVDAAEDLGIPYLLITLDADLMAWVPGLENIKHPVFAVTIGYDAPGTRTLLKEHKIPDASIYTIGFPIRQSFTQSYNRAELRKKWNIEPEIPTILVMMGGIGTSTALTYAKALAKMPLRAHVIVCAGKNEELKQQVEALSLTSPEMKIQALGFTQEIPELMTLSDVLITKGGGVSLYEAIACKLPLLCHKIGVQVPWEASNIDFIVNSEFGFAITDMNQLEELVTKMTTDPKLSAEFKKNMSKHHPIKFYTEVRELVHKMQKQKYVAFNKREERSETPWWETVSSWCSSVIQDVAQTIKGVARSVKKYLF